MMQQQYEQCLNILSVICREVPDWQAHPQNAFEDYMIEMYEERRTLIAIGSKVYNRLSAIPEGALLTRDMCVDIISELHDKTEDVNLSAYFFAIKLFSDLLGINCEIYIDELGEELLEDRIFPQYASFDAIPRDERLLYFKNRLLDFSRSNPLVHFKPLKTNIPLSYPASPSILDALRRQDKVYLEAWSHAGVARILRCESCGRHFLKKYEKGTEEHALACPDCDQKKRTKQAKPLPQNPIVVSAKNPYVCTCSACGQENRVTEAVTTTYPVCSSCGAELPIPSYPVLSDDLLRVSGDVFCIPGVDDRRSLQSADSLIKYATKLKTNYGLHSLYLACGFLHWRSVSGQTYNSPLLLCKIGLSIDKSRSRAYIYMDDTDGDAITVNHTLRKMLENYSESIAVALPAYDPASSIDAYMDALRVVLNRFPETSAWEVDPTVYIGKFYYHKLQLEKDFDDHFDVYAQHPMVRKLCGVESNDPSDEDTSPLLFLEPITDTPNTDNFSVLDADSSQEYVVEAARSGKNFILQGPPGTGKSQTITNIIADAVGNGKTVLFVTEKASARNIISDNFQGCVVQGASGGHNLTDYILNAENMAAKKGNGEINKTDLRKFINDSFTHADPIPWREKAPEHRLFEEKLRNVYEFLAADREKSGAVLQLIEQWLPLADCETVDFLGADMAAIDLNDATVFIQNFYAACGGDLDYTKHPLYGYTERNLLCPSFGHIQELRASLEALREEILAVGEELDDTPTGDTVEALRQSLALPAALNELPALCFHVLAQKGNATAIGDPATCLTAAMEYAKERLAARESAQRLPFFDMETYVDVDKLMAVDPAALRAELESHSFFVTRIGKKYADVKARIYAPLRTPPAKVNYTACLNTLTMLETCQNTQREKQAYEAGFTTDASTFGNLFAGWDTDLSAIIGMLSTGIAFFRAQDEARVRNILGRVLRSMAGGAGYDTLIRECLARMDAALSHVTADIARLNDVFDKRIVKFTSMTLAELADYLGRFDLPLDQVSRWAKLQMLLYGVRDDRNLNRILKTIIDKHPATAAEAVNILAKAHYRAVIMAALNEHADIFPFLSRDGFEGTVADYRRNDSLRLRAAPVHLFNRLLGLKNTTCDTFYAKHRRKNLIQKYMGISIKELIRSHWEQIRAVTPCIMMSPLNVSQYLDISVKFDLVIFDEASQIFLEESLASVVRGHQLIISGDEQQLPPFDFARATTAFGGSDNYLEEEFSSGESILTAALRSSIDSHSLRWHYRSADESLIYFSNRHFYGNSLVTFPAAHHDPDHGIFYHFVDNGCYLSARERTNAAEAQKVVELLCNEITSERFSGNSIGVVAFNLMQAEAIEQAWLHYLATNHNPKVDAWLKRQEEMHEPLIFCNLDTIQGDERDTMIISTTYGHNTEDIFRLSFLGPVRLENGKKRINVAITRAKRRMLVVTSMTSAQLESAIAASSGRNEGATTLMEFLRYAESFSAPRAASDLTADTPLLRSICGILDEAGIAYDVHVGLSEYKVQIGIKRSRRPAADGTPLPSRPASMENADGYVLGILTDEQGLAGQSVRDLARHRDFVLSGKYAWSLYHVYMLPWFWNYESERDALLCAVREALKDA